MHGSNGAVFWHRGRYFRGMRIDEVNPLNSLARESVTHTRMLAYPMLDIETASIAVTWRRDCNE